MEEKNSIRPNNSMRVRSIVILIIILILLLGCLTVHLFRVCVVQHGYYEKMANDIHFGSIKIEADRGGIYDTNNTPLAWSATVYKVYIDPALYRKEIEEFNDTDTKLIKQKKTVEKAKKDDSYVDTDALKSELVNYLSDKLEISKETVTAALDDDTSYKVLKTQVEKETADEITNWAKEKELGCIASEKDTKRYYTQNDLAASVIGFTDSDGNGQYGIEAQYDNYLAGTPGRVSTAVDANGNEMPYNNAVTYDAIDGGNVYLTLDVTMQYYLEKELKAMTEEHKVRNRSCGIIMNAKTGAIYAMATYPSFDLNNPSAIADKTKADEIKSLSGKAREKAYSEAREEQWKNKNVQEIYTPGSVFKVYTASAAIEEKAIDTDTFGYDCIGYYQIEDRKINCSNTAGHGYQTFQQAMTNSCNPAFIDIGLKLGINKFSQFFRAFGLTEATGIDLPGEAQSIYVDEKDMTDVDLASASFGQSTKITPIQMITGYAAVINGGYLLQPYVVGEIRDSNSNIIMQNKRTVKRQVISSETSAKMREVLENVVKDAPGSNSYITGYRIGGKTGTAEKLDEYSDDEMQYVASYCTFAPANDPEIIMLIVADEPDNSEDAYYGSKVAVPAATKLLKEILPYIGYYPEYSDSDYSSLTSTVPDVTGVTLSDAEKSISAENLSYEVIGDGNTVAKQFPESQSTMLAGGTVMLYTDETETEQSTVPNLVGYSLSAAKNLLYKEGLNLYIADVSENDSDLVVETQSIVGDTKVDRGTVISLTLGQNRSSSNGNDNDNGDNNANDVGSYNAENNEEN